MYNNNYKLKMGKRNNKRIMRKKVNKVKQLKINVVLKYNEKNDLKLKKRYMERLINGEIGGENIREGLKCKFYDIVINGCNKGYILYYKNVNKIYISFILITEQLKGYGRMVINHLKTMNKTIEIISEFKNETFWNKCGFVSVNIVEFSNEVNLRMKYIVN